MATFVGAEYIIANLLIAMKKNHNRDSISLEELRQLKKRKRIKKQHVNRMILN